MPSRLDALRGFLERDPDDPFTRYAIALEHASRNDIAAATAELEETLRRTPGYVPAMHELARLLERAGDTNRAMELLRRGIAEARAQGDGHAADDMQHELDTLEDS